MTCKPSSNPTNDFSNGDYDLAKVVPSYESPLLSAIQALDREVMCYANNTFLDKVLIEERCRAMVEAAARASFFSICFFLVVFLAAIGKYLREGERQCLRYMCHPLKTITTTI